MNEIIIIPREKLKDMLDEYFKKCPDHVFLMDLVPRGETTIFEMYPESEYTVSHTFATFLDNITSKIPKKTEDGVTKETAENMLNFIFSVRNFPSAIPKRLIIACKDGREVSGAVAMWAMDWIMDESQEDFLRKLNPDIKPNEFILADLYLHPLI